MGETTGPENRSPVGRRRWVEWAKGLAVVLAVAAVLVVVELVLRVAYPQGGSPKIHEFDPVIGHRMRAGVDLNHVWDGHDNVTPIRTNSIGLRGPEAETDADVTILVQGDSYTFGYGVAGPDAFPALVERMWNERPGGDPRIAVVNAGVSSYGTAHELLQYLDLRDRVSPDLVLLVMFVGNDIQDNLCLDYLSMSRHRRFPCFRMEHDEPVLATSPQRPPVSSSSGIDPLGWIRRSELLAWTSSRGKQFLVARPGLVRALDGVGLPLTPGYLPHVVTGWYSEHTAEGWSLTRALIGSLADAAREDGARFAVVAIPSRIQVIPELAEVAETLYAGVPDFEAYREDDRRPQRMLAEFVADEGIPFLDLLPALRDGGLGMKLYYPNVAHWNERGHRIAAGAIVELLSDILSAEHVATPESAPKPIQSK